MTYSHHQSNTSDIGLGRWIWISATHSLIQLPIVSGRWLRLSNIPGYCIHSEATVYGLCIVLVHWLWSWDDNFYLNLVWIYSLGSIHLYAISYIWQSLLARLNTFSTWDVFLAAGSWLQLSTKNAKCHPHFKLNNVIKCYINHQLFHSHDGSMVLVYMLTWLGYIDGIHVTYIAAPWILWDSLRFFFRSFSPGTPVAAVFPVPGAPVSRAAAARDARARGPARSGAAWSACGRARWVARRNARWRTSGNFENHRGMV